MESLPALQRPQLGTQDTMTYLFQKRALDKQYSDKTSRKPVALLRPPLKATAYLAVGLAVAGVGWSFLAEIPIYVEGTGVMVPVSTVTTLKALSDGEIFYRFTDKGMNAPRWAQLAWRYESNPETISELEIRQLAPQLLKLPNREIRFNKERFYPDVIKTGQLIAQIDSPQQRIQLQSAIDNLNKVTIDTRKVIASSTSEKELLRVELVNRSAYLKQVSNLMKRGYATREIYLQEAENVTNIKEQIININNNIIQASSQQRQAVEQLKSNLAAYIDTTLLFAETDLYLQEVIATPQAKVNAGDELMITSNSAIKEPALVPIYLSAKEATQTFPGMKVLATPAGIDRAQYGGMVGSVYFVAKLPASPNEIASRVGLPSLATLIGSQEPSATEAVIALDRAPNGRQNGNNSGYVWSTRGQPPYAVKSGDLIDVQITTRKIRPIELVLPFLKNIFGFSPRMPVTGATNH